MPLLGGQHYRERGALARLRMEFQLAMMVVNDLRSN
jgi:hypothetical protein